MLVFVCLLSACIHILSLLLHFVSSSSTTTARSGLLVTGHCFILFALYSFRCFLVYIASLSIFFFQSSASPPRSRPPSSGPVAASTHYLRSMLASESVLFRLAVGLDIPVSIVRQAISQILQNTHAPAPVHTASASAAVIVSRADDPSLLILLFLRCRNLSPPCVLVFLSPPRLMILACSRLLHTTCPHVSFQHLSIIVNIFLQIGQSFEPVESSESACSFCLVFCRLS